MNKHFLLHLTLIDGIGPYIVQRIMQSPRSDVQTSDLYHLSASDWMRYVGLSEVTAQKLVTGLADTMVLEKELELVEKHKVQLVTFADQTYPQLLKEIHLPPIVLYFYGVSFDNSLIPNSVFSSLGSPREEKRNVGFNKALAIVGSRKANEYGQRVINALVPDLVAAGYTIVSGGALGIDTMAHEAALQHGGKTIAILGSGLLKLYPTSNKKLFAQIVEAGGVVASSFPLMTEPFPTNFPARNRIVTGLSQGCLVAQAAKKSGALISAHCALEQGREVFAVPGLFDDELSAGCHEIIQQGAKLVMSSADIFNELGDSVQIYNANSAQPGIEQKALQQQILFSSDHSERQEKYSPAQHKIIAACKRPASIEDIVAVTQLSFEQIQAELFTLQLDGVLSQDFMGMWIFAH